MGVYYWFADYTNKRYIDGYAAKSAEWRGSQFDQAMITNYLMNNHSEPLEVKFVADENGEWDDITSEKFEDYTCDNIYDMFENGYFNHYTQKAWIGNLSWILDKFSKQNKLSMYLEIANKVPEFMEHYKVTICDTLEKPNGTN